MSARPATPDEPFVPAGYRPPVTQDLALEAWAVARRLVELEATGRTPATTRGTRLTTSQPVVDRRRTPTHREGRA